MEIIYNHFESIASTNDWVKAHLKGVGKGTLLLVTADEQTGGRGQYGRQWISPKGENIYATFGFIAAKSYPPLSLTHLLALSTVRSLNELGIESRIKWPNDLLVDGKKIAGILCETLDFSPDFGIALGIGLNVNMNPESLAKLGRPATSIYAETGQQHPLQDVLSKITGHFTTDLSLFFEKGFEPFEPLFQKLLY